MAKSAGTPAPAAAEPAATNGNQEDRTPSPGAITPPPMNRQRGLVMDPALVETMAGLAAKGWASNGLDYGSESAAHKAVTRIRTAIVEAGHATTTKDLTSRVWKREDGRWVFAIGAKSAVRS